MFRDTLEPSCSMFGKQEKSAPIQETFSHLVSVKTSPEHPKFCKP